jgi:hypothetical protein
MARPEDVKTAGDAFVQVFVTHTGEGFQTMDQVPDWSDLVFDNRQHFEDCVNAAVDAVRAQIRPEDQVAIDARVQNGAALILGVADLPIADLRKRYDAETGGGLNTNMTRGQLVAAIYTAKVGNPTVTDADAVHHVQIDPVTAPQQEETTDGQEQP